VPLLNRVSIPLSRIAFSAAAFALIAIARCSGERG
jgi:hypothetical protein